MSHTGTEQTEVRLVIDGQSITVPIGTTIFDAARTHGIPIPVLCHQQDITPVGVCRMCVVDTHERAYAAACIRKVEPNARKAKPEDPDLVVETNSENVRAARKTLLELMMADHPTPCVRQQQKKDCELEGLAAEYGATTSPYPHRELTRGRDTTSPIILVDHAACILCDRCVRACAELRDNFVIARQGKGYNAGIAFDLGKPMGSSSCVSCGECMYSCPTGALTNTVSVKHEFKTGTPCETADLMALDVFQHVSGNFLDFNKGAVVKRHFKKGEFFFREGEGSSTAFYILEGLVDMYISTQQAHVHTEEQRGTFSSRMRSKLVNRHQHRRQGEDMGRTHVVVDGGLELPCDQPEGQRGPGALFGEMSCMNAHPHSTTARAATDCVVLEMRRNIVDMLRRNKTFRENLDELYLTHTLELHLRKSPVFSSLTREFIQALRSKVRLVRIAPGEIIFKQGDLADAFYLVRRGFVKVTESCAGGDLVLAYLPAGSHFGEPALLGDGKHMATCSALDNVDHVDLVRIAGEDFKEMIRLFPQVHAELQKVHDEHMRENQKRMANISDVPLAEFLHQGLVEAQSLLVLNLDNCTRCDQCVKACADAHDGVTRLVRDGLRVDNFLIATSCRHCRDPLCMVCPVGAIHRQVTLDVTIDDTCIGCGECAQNCPYGNINLHEFEVTLHGEELAALGAGQAHAKKATVRKATSCNLCNELKEPSCVYACPHDAAHRVTGEEFRDMLKK